MSGYSGYSAVSGYSGYSGLLTGSSSNIAFTDGDTVRRVTITDGAVSSTSKIIGSIIRPTTLDSADPGYNYVCNVVSRGAGTFDVLVYATLGGSELDVDINPPNETVVFAYLVAA